ncbi:uncharacterized protein J3D65DRAFT_274462 [Phyllosticta citribraziliensis]|uniref:Uncharacterized protein n=1 Tax=Phyllosticta citribraziliensis TaxID=989973 RepID=A0ABR1LVR2_9PEZI
MLPATPHALAFRTTFATRCCSLTAVAPLLFLFPTRPLVPERLAENYQNARPKPRASLGGLCLVARSLPPPHSPPPSPHLKAPPPQTTASRRKARLVKYLHHEQTGGHDGWWPDGSLHCLSARRRPFISSTPPLDSTLLSPPLPISQCGVPVRGLAVCLPSAVSRTCRGPRLW